MPLQDMEISISFFMSVSLAVYPYGVYRGVIPMMIVDITTPPPLLL